MAITSSIAAILETLGYGTWGGGTTDTATIFTGHEPDASVTAACITLYAVGGAPDLLDFSGNTNGERPVQVRFRDPDPVALETRIESLYALWSAWKAYPSSSLTIKASTKPMTNYPTEDSNVGSLFIGSFNVTVIAGS